VTSVALPEPSRGLSVRPVSLLAAFIRRDWALAWSYRLPFFVGIAQSLVTVAFLYFLGLVVNNGVTAVGAHTTYFGFVVFGTVMVSMFSVTLTSIAVRLRTDQTTGTLEVLFTMPPSPSLLVVAGAAYQMIYSAALGIVTVGFACAIGLRLHVTAASALVGLAGIVVSLAFFAALGVGFAAYVMVFKRGETIVSLATAGLTLLGGVYYPVALLPEPLRAIAQVLPFTWSVSVIRGAFLAAQTQLLTLLELTLATAVVLPLVLFVFSLALRHARRAGTMGQY
jgi:ABC-2 type transport system permease protein